MRPRGAGPESILPVVVMEARAEPAIGRAFARPGGALRNDAYKARSLSVMSYITGVGLTAFGKHEGSSSLDLMSKAAVLAIADAGLKRAEVDGILCGYSTVAPHIMLATVFAEHFGIRPAYAHAVQVGGATGLAMTMLACPSMCWWWAARTGSPDRAAMPRSWRWPKWVIPITRYRWGRRFRPITASSPRATCMNMA